MIDMGITKPHLPSELEAPTTAMVRGSNSLPQSRSNLPISMARLNTNRSESPSFRPVAPASRRLSAKVAEVPDPFATFDCRPHSIPTGQSVFLYSVFIKGGCVGPQIRIPVRASGYLLRSDLESANRARRRYPEQSQLPKPVNPAS